MVFAGRRGVIPADPGAHNVSLTAPADLLPEPFPGALQVAGLLGGWHDVRGDSLAARGKLDERARVEVAVDGHGDRARDRRGGHHQHVRAGVARLLPERVALLDAEPVLLVDDHQPQVGELHVLLEQGVRADHDPGRT